MQNKGITNVAPSHPLRITEKLRKNCRLCQGTCALKSIWSSDEDEDLQENQPDMVEVVTHKSQSCESVIDYLRQSFLTCISVIM